MTHAKLETKTRSTLGNSVRKLRREGILPAVIYSKKVQPRSIEVKSMEFLKVFKQAGKTHVVDLQIDNSEKMACIIHDIDVHPVTLKPLHIDFLAVDLNQEVTVSVPIKYINEAPGAKEFGAIVSTNINEVEVEALPESIPEAIEIDLSVLQTLDDVIRVSDIPTGKGYTIVADPELSLASLIVEKEEVEETPVTVVETGTETPEQS